MGWAVVRAVVVLPLPLALASCRECHGFLNLYRSQVQVSAGMGMGHESQTHQLSNESKNHVFGLVLTRKPMG